jgi:inorganic pyrophosphatase
MASELVVDVFIEITKDSNIKYKYDKTQKALIVNRILPPSFKFLLNYGSLPNTVNNDGQEMDAIILMDEPLIPGSYISCKMIGILEYQDEKGIDNKFIMCPSDSIDPRFSLLNDITDLSDDLVEKIRQFIANFKGFNNKAVKTGRILDKNFAIYNYNKSLSMFTIM